MNMLFWPESQVRSRSVRGKARAKPVNDLSSGFRTGQDRRTGQGRTDATLVRAQTHYCQYLLTTFTIYTYLYSAMLIERLCIYKICYYRGFSCIYICSNSFIWNVESETAGHQGCVFNIYSIVLYVLTLLFFLHIYIYIISTQTKYYKIYLPVDCLRIQAKQQPS